MAAIACWDELSKTGRVSTGYVRVEAVLRAALVVLKMFFFGTSGLDPKAIEPRFSRGFV